MEDVSWYKTKTFELLKMVHDEYENVYLALFGENNENIL